MVGVFLCFKAYGLGRVLFEGLGECFSRVGLGLGLVLFEACTSASLEHWTGVGLGLFECCTGVGWWSYVKMQLF